MKKLFSLITELGKGSVKPLPLSGILTTIKEVKESKWEFEKVIKLAGYVLVGIALWGFILGKITVEDLLAFIKAIGV